MVVSGSVTLDLGLVPAGGFLCRLVISDCLLSGLRLCLRLGLGYCGFVSVGLGVWWGCVWLAGGWLRDGWFSDCVVTVSLLVVLLIVLVSLILTLYV